jgi:hypothetical protein
VGVTVYVGFIRVYSWKVASGVGGMAGDVGLKELTTTCGLVVQADHD